MGRPAKNWFCMCLRSSGHSISCPNFGNNPAPAPVAKLMTNEETKLLLEDLQETQTLLAEARKQADDLRYALKADGLADPGLHPWEKRA